MAAYIVFTIIFAIAMLGLAAFITYKWIKKADRPNLYFLILIEVLVFVAFIGCALGWGGVIK